jgi:hypothetical protein
MKDSGKKHHTIEVSSMLKRQAQLYSAKKNSFDIEDKKLTEEAEDIEENFANHKQLLISDDPVRSCINSCS